jgi:hypothetical protein
MAGKQVVSKPQFFKFKKILVTVKENKPFINPDIKISNLYIEKLPSSHKFEEM